MSLMCTVNALREIFDQLGKKNWNFNANLCYPNLTDWDPMQKQLYANTVFCNCTFPGDICHVQAMYVFDLLSVSALVQLCIISIKQSWYVKQL